MIFFDTLLCNIFKHEFLDASRSYFFPLLLLLLFLPYEISLYFTLITQKIFLSLVSKSCMSQGSKKNLLKYVVRSRADSRSCYKQVKDG